jgi:hypothetical protein
MTHSSPVSVPLEHAPSGAVLCSTISTRPLTPELRCPPCQIFPLPVWDLIKPVRDPAFDFSKKEKPLY